MCDTTPAGDPCSPTNPGAQHAVRTGSSCPQQSVFGSSVLLVSDWGAIATTTAIVPGVVYYIIDKWRDRRALAKLVAFDTSSEVRHSPDGRDRDIRLSLTVRNNSELPIFNVRISLKRTSIYHVVFHHTLLDEGQALVDEVKSQDRWVFPGTATVPSISSGQSHQFDMSRLPTGVTVFYFAKVYFADGKSNLWRITVRLDELMSSNVVRIRRIRNNPYGSYWDEMPWRERWLGRWYGVKHVIETWWCFRADNARRLSKRTQYIARVAMWGERERTKQISIPGEESRPQ